MVLRSPRELALTARNADRLVLGFEEPGPRRTGARQRTPPPQFPRRLRVDARAGDAGAWRRLADVADVSTLARAPAGLVVPLAVAAGPAGPDFDRLRIELEFADGRNRAARAHRGAAAEELSDRRRSRAPSGRGVGASAAGLSRARRP